MHRGNSTPQNDGIDRQARADLQAALISYMRGDIRTFAFDDRNSAYLPPVTSTDAGVLEISRVLYGIHDDIIDHPISVTPAGWATLRRVIAFLGADLRFQPAIDHQAWPFRDEAQWQEHEILVINIDLPEYDPLVHNLPINHWSRRIPIVVGIAVIAGLIALGTLVWMFMDALR